MIDPDDPRLKYFRDKLNIPTESWDQLIGQANAKGFTVAGAVQADVLGDLRAAVDSAIAEGESIGQFRKRFDDIVAASGWSYRGKRGWRTRVIYDNNLRSANMAGRWAQIQRTKQRRPYIEYQTAGDLRVRPEHAQWDGKILPVNDPWWQTHYPPNGWGCRCTVRTLSESEIEERGLTVDTSPAVNMVERVNTSTGEVLGEHPAGIDTGWGFNAGQAWLGPDVAFGESIMQLPTPLRDRALNNAQSLTGQLQHVFRPWAQALIDNPKARGEIRTVGYLTPEAVRVLEQRGAAPTTAVITVTDRDLAHVVRDAKGDRRVSKDLLLDLPTRMRAPDQLLWDKRDPTLLYVFDLADDTRAKFVIRIGYRTKARTEDGRRLKLKTNELVTGGVVKTSDLAPSVYDRLEGGD